MSATQTRVIVTADDFGLHPAVNEAVARAHADGVLGTASLMVGAPAADEAITLAKTQPTLGVGLHLVLTDGAAILPPAEIPDLVDANGRFHDGMARTGARFFFRPAVRRQLAAEIRAQYEAFAATGLPLDHVNAHKHFHVHPTILNIALSIGREYGLRAVRWPCEPRSTATAASAADRRSGELEAAIMTPWLRWMRGRFTVCGVASNDRLLGLRASGRMNEARMLAAVADAAVGGVAEIYLHPASRNKLTPTMGNYDHCGELVALLSKRVAESMHEAGLTRVRFADLV